jgi:hypothetical protein
MEEDFSVRNEVDSLKAPYEDKTERVSETDSSPYHDILEGIANAPPFPAAPLHPDPWANHQYQLYDAVVKQQLRTIQQQQLINEKLLSFIQLKKNNSISWKDIALVLAALVLFLIFRPNKIVRQNPRTFRNAHFPMVEDDLFGPDDHYI